MVWIFITVIGIVIIVAIANANKKSTPPPSVKKNYSNTIRKDMYRENIEDEELKNNLFKNFYEEYKHYSIIDLEILIERGRKSQYNDYSLEDKMKFKAQKTLIEELQIKEFRDFFMLNLYKKKNYALTYLKSNLNMIRYYESRGMEPIPQNILSDYRDYISNLELNNDIKVVSDLSIVKLKNWMERREDKKIHPLLIDYFQYRLDNEELELNLLKEKSKASRNIDRNKSLGNNDKSEIHTEKMNQILENIESLKKSFFDSHNTQ